MIRPKGGNATLENWELKITKFWRVEGNLGLSFSLPTEVKNQKNIIALAQKQHNWRIVLGLFSPTPFASQYFLLEMERKGKI